MPPGVSRNNNTTAGGGLETFAELIPLIGDDEDGKSARYEFPRAKLQTLCRCGKIPVIPVLCGSFSPITYLHLRMLGIINRYET